MTGIRCFLSLNPFLSPSFILYSHNRIRFCHVSDATSPITGHQTVMTFSYFIADRPIPLPHCRRHLASRFFRMQHATSPMRPETNLTDISTKQGWSMVTDTWLRGVCRYKIKRAMSPDTALLEYQTFGKKLSITLFKYQVCILMSAGTRCSYSQNTCLLWSDRSCNVRL